MTNKPTSKMVVKSGKTTARAGLFLAAWSAIAGAALVAGGCEGFLLPGEPEPRLAEPQRLHPIGAAIEDASYDFQAAEGPRGVESETYFEVIRFLRQYRRDARGPLIIRASGHEGGRVARALATVRSLASQNGVHRISVRQGSGHGPTVKLSYERIVAVAPEECRNWQEDAGRRPEAGPYPNWGCASQRNLANMVADPTELVAPALEAPRPSDKRATSYKGYVGTPPQTTETIKK